MSEVCISSIHLLFVYIFIVLSILKQCIGSGAFCTIRNSAAIFVNKCLFLWLFRIWISVAPPFTVSGDLQKMIQFHIQLFVHFIHKTKLGTRFTPFCTAIHSLFRSQNSFECATGHGSHINKFVNFFRWQQFRLPFLEENRISQKQAVPLFQTSQKTTNKHVVAWSERNSTVCSRERDIQGMYQVDFSNEGRNYNRFVPQRKFAVTFGHS